MNQIGLNPPNAITLARLLAAPLVIWLILGGQFGLAFGVFVAAGISDGLDGYIAKRFDMRTRLGALLDPIADKTLLVSVFVALGLEGKLPDWLVILVVFRDVMIIGGYMLIQVTAAARQFDPLYISKINTAGQIALVSFVLAQLGVGFADGPITPILVWGVAGTTVLSGGSYFVRWARILAGAEPAL